MLPLMGDGLPPRQLYYGDAVYIQNGFKQWDGGYLDTCGGFSGDGGNLYAVSTASSPDRAQQGTGTWKILPAGSKSLADPIAVGDRIYLQNNYQNWQGGYLDTCGSASCRGNLYGVSTAPSTNRSGEGTGTWKIVSLSNQAAGAPLHAGDPIYLQNGHLNWAGGYLDTCGDASGAGSLYGVSTASSPDRAQRGTGTWRCLFPANGEVFKLQVTVMAASDYFAGTADVISLGFNRSPSQIMFNGVTRGQSATIEINLQAMFGGVIRVSDLSTIEIYQRPSRHTDASDSWKLASVLVEVNGRFYYYGFMRINHWLDNPDSTLDPVWTGAFNDWATWTMGNDTPVDTNLQTYTVGFKPWIGDILKWRNYNPATILGVGLVVGVKNRQIVGEQLKTQTCEIIAPGAYTWVYTPDGAIIYKYWDKSISTDNYIRHSQLGSGQPVICAGELQIEAVQGSRSISTVIGMVNDASGHYKPDGGASLKHFGQKLQQLGIPTDRVQWYWRDQS